MAQGHRRSCKAGSPLVAPLSRKNSSIFSSCLVWHLALAWQIPWARAERARPCKGRGGLGFPSSGKHPAYPPIEPCVPSPGQGLRRDSQDPGPVEPGALGRLGAWSHENPQYLRLDKTLEENKEICLSLRSSLLALARMPLGTRSSPLLKAIYSLPLNTCDC